ncbi:MAG: hypothetical protein LC667_05480, partial [Thioalkalivibrio sp.]|nr:hypothetical protein [Thioalkalivibrio sp.]
IGLRGGAPVPLLGGARIVARAGGTDLGALVMRSRSVEGASPETFGVMRFKRQVLNANSYIGHMSTARMDADGMYNLALGLDTRINAFGDDYLTVAVAKTLESDGINLETALDNARIWAEWRNTRGTGLAYDLGFAHAGPDYRPGLGFQNRSDYKAFTGSGAFRWRPDGDSRVTEQGFALAAASYLRNADHTLESGSVDLSYSVGLRSNHVFIAGVVGTEEDLRSPFDLSDDAGVPAGRYRAVAAQLGYTMPTRYPLRTNVNVTAGQFFDGTRLSVGFSPFWTPVPKFKVTGGYEVNRITFGARDQSFTAHVARAQTELMFDTRVTFSSLIQYNSAADDFSVNARLRINPREGTDFYLVYSESLLTDLGSAALLPPRSRGRTLLVKFSRTLFP